MFKRSFLYVSAFVIFTTATDSMAFNVKDTGKHITTMATTVVEKVKKIPTKHIGMIAIPAAAAYYVYRSIHSFNIITIRAQHQEIVDEFTTRMKNDPDVLNSITLEELRAFETAQEIVALTDEQLQAQLNREAKYIAIGAGVLVASIYGLIAYRKNIMNIPSHFKKAA